MSNLLQAAKAQHIPVQRLYTALTHVTVGYCPVRAANSQMGLMQPTYVSVAGS